jgi:hypothetical protein
MAGDIAVGMYMTGMNVSGLARYQSYSLDHIFNVMMLDGNRLHFIDL